MRLPVCNVVFEWGTCEDAPNKCFFATLAVVCLELKSVCYQLDSNAPHIPSTHSSFARPWLVPRRSNRGNVRVVEIDGPVVKLELEGACGSCPSSTMTMKMGLERRLVQRIPEISEVVQSLPNGPELNVSQEDTRRTR